MDAALIFCTVQIREMLRQGADRGTESGGSWQLKVHGTVIRRVEKFQPVCAEFQRPRGRRAAVLPVSGQRASEMRHLYPDLMMASCIEPDLN